MNTRRSRTPNSPGIAQHLARTPLSPHRSVAVTSKPTANVLPISLSGNRCNGGRASSIYRSVACQSDEVDIDVDLLMHVEDMVRTQRSLVLYKTSSLASMTPSGAAITSQLPSSLEGGAGRRVTTLLECLEENERLRNSLSLQTKVNADLKRLVVGALAGDQEMADRLIDSTAESATSSRRLLEAADSASIAADIWRAKCLAGRVVATRAGQKAAHTSRALDEARHALAHLLGERARLRNSLIETAECILNRKAESRGPVVNVADTLGLARLCQELALEESNPPAKSLKVVCQHDSAGERLAVNVLLGASNNEQDLHCELREDTEDIPPVPSPTVSTGTPDEKFISEALQTFASSRRVLDAEQMCLTICRYCRGDVYIV